MPAPYSTYDEDLAHTGYGGYGGRGRLGNSYYAPQPQQQLSQRVNLHGQKWFPVKAVNSNKWILKNAHQTTQRERSRTRVGPVHDPNGRVLFIPKKNIHRAFDPRGRQVGRVQRYAHANGEVFTPQAGRARSASRDTVGTRRSNKSGGGGGRRRDTSADSRHSGRSQKGKRGGGKQGEKKGKDAIGKNNPVIKVVEAILRDLKKLKQDAPVAFTPEQIERYAKGNAELAAAKAGRTGLLRFASPKTISYFEEVDPAALVGKSKSDAFKEVLKIKRTIIKAAKIAKRSAEIHNHNKAQKIALVKNNLNEDYTDATSWTRAALRIAQQSVVQVRSWAEVGEIVPYVIHEKFLLERLRTSPTERITAKEITKKYSAEIISWLFTSGKQYFQGFDVLDKILLHNGLYPFLIPAIKKAAEIHTGATRVKTGGNFEIDGDVDLHAALHAHLLKSGIAVAAESEFAESNAGHLLLETAPPPAAAAAVASGMPPPTRFVSMVTF
jgi:hypothetical protein